MPRPTLGAGGLDGAGDCARTGSARAAARQATLNGRRVMDPGRREENGSSWPRRYPVPEGGAMTRRDETPQMSTLPSYADHFRTAVQGTVHDLGAVAEHRAMYSGPKVVRVRGESRHLRRLVTARHGTDIPAVW